MPAATHLIKVSGFIVKPPGISEEELRGWIIGLFKGKIPPFDLENVEIEKC